MPCLSLCEQRDGRHGYSSGKEFSWKARDDMRAYQEEGMTFEKVNEAVSKYTRVVLRLGGCSISGHRGWW